MNVEKIEVMRISTQSSSAQTKLHTKKENVKYFNYLGRRIANNGRYTREIKSMIIMSKAAINKEESLFTNKLDLNIKKKLIKCYIWSIHLHGAEI